MFFALDTSSRKYDALIIGSGFGGAAAAYRLSSKGLRVLMIERGSWPKRDEKDWDPREIFIHQRYKSRSPLLIKQYQSPSFEQKFLSETVGGLSVFFGGVCLRLRESDFRRWPLSYRDFEPYYTEAEALLEVHGSANIDPTEPFRSSDYPFPAVPVQAHGKRVFDAATGLGYKPFPVPLALNVSNPARPRCILCHTCDGFPCKIEAKNDAITTLLSKATRDGLEILTEFRAKKLIEKAGRIVGVECLDLESGQSFVFRADQVILSAGAIQSPTLILESGLQNEAVSLVGRFLMRHANAILSYIFPKKTNPENILTKQLCLTDFYEDFRDSLGTATGTLQGNYLFDPSLTRFFAPRGMKSIAYLLASRSIGFLVIAEDDPQFENRVFLGDQKDSQGFRIPKIEHRYSANDLKRRDYLIQKAKKILKACGGWFPYTHFIDSFSHAVGTLRFGDDARQSVLDLDCRFRGIENLYVLDGSFMPTSAGVNPSLTIVANALRVSDRIG